MVGGRLRSVVALFWKAMVHRLRSVVPFFESWYIDSEAQSLCFELWYIESEAWSLFFELWYIDSEA